jgi:hypothetical protein
MSKFSGILSITSFFVFVAALIFASTHSLGYSTRVPHEILELLVLGGMAIGTLSGLHFIASCIHPDENSSTRSDEGISNPSPVELLVRTANFSKPLYEKTNIMVGLDYNPVIYRGTLWTKPDTSTEQSALTWILVSGEAATREDVTLALKRLNMTPLETTHAVSLWRPPLNGKN